jgi:hypothetical protein
MDKISPSQLAAHTLWACATSDDRNLASYDSKAYRSAERAFVAIVRTEYGLSALMAGRVRNLLAEYGPRDSLIGTTGHGVASYVQYVKANRGHGR